MRVSLIFWLAVLPLTATGTLFNTTCGAGETPATLAAKDSVSDKPTQPETPVELLTIERIFSGRDFKTQSFGPYEWLDRGAAYTTIESVDSPEEEVGHQEAVAEDQDAAATQSEGGDAEASVDKKPDTQSDTQSDTEQTSAEDEKDEPPKHKAIVRYETASGNREVLVSAEQLTPAGAERPLSVQNYDWSRDKTKLLIFTNTARVWRHHSRGDYWVLDLADGTLRRVGAGSAPSTMMFAKFSPQGDRVAYVRDHNIYVETLGTGETVQLTSDGTDKVINGTFDWVYEEELDLRDGFRWSPDGEHIAYWQLDSNGIKDFYIINNTDELYPTLTAIPYPKVGTTNSACRIGVVPASGGKTVWIPIVGDPRENYLADLEWVADSQQVLIEQLNRLQNHRILWRANIEGGEVVSVFEDRDEAWIDARLRFDGYESDTHRLVLSEQDGWRHAYRVGIQDGTAELLTPGDYDVISLVGVDAEAELLYFTASPDDPIRQYLYHVPLAGGSPTRVTPEGEEGQHTYDVSPNGKWAVHTYSAMSKPPVIDLVALPDHSRVRLLEGNSEVTEKLAALDLGPLEFFRVNVELENGPTEENQRQLALDGWIMKPPGFDPSLKYPILFFVYTEPWGQTARDGWGGDRYLWHRMLTQQGYLVATVDNRGTPAPRGRAWRKAIYRKIGIVNVADQAAATREILQWPFVDEARVGVWGWSGGGTMTLNAMFQHPELYHVGMAVAPVGDERLYDTIYQERYMGLPEDNQQGFTQGSPVTHADKLQGDLLLVHGTGDDNVHYQNSEVVINALIRGGRQFDMMAYPNRTHGISEGKGTRPHLYTLLTRYLTTHLPAGGVEHAGVE